MFCLLAEWQIYYKTWSAELFSLLGNKTLNWGLYASLTSFLAAPSSFPKFRVHPSGVGMAHITGTPSIPCSRAAVPFQPNEWTADLILNSQSLFLFRLTTEMNQLTDTPTNKSFTYVYSYICKGVRCVLWPSKVRNVADKLRDHTRSSRAGPTHILHPIVVVWDHLTSVNANHVGRAFLKEGRWE